MQIVDEKQGVRREGVSPAELLATRQKVVPPAMFPGAGCTEIVKEVSRELCPRFQYQKSTFSVQHDTHGS